MTWRRGVDRFPLRLILIAALMLTAFLPLVWPTRVATPVHAYRAVPAPAPPR